MANINKWNNDCWLLLMQSYMKKPVGLKPVGTKDMVELAMELHVTPKLLGEKMAELDKHESPSLQKIWCTYHDNTRRLNRDAKLVRKMMGFGDAGLFYEGVETDDSMCHSFLPVDKTTDLSPAMLTLVLRLYFSLTPGTMVENTPEVEELAQCMKTTQQSVVQALEMFQTFDPILKREPAPESPLKEQAKLLWNKYYNDAHDTLNKKANEIEAYFEGKPKLKN